MTENQSAHQSIPLLRSNEEQLAKIRRQLEGMFRELRLVQDVIMVCGGVRESIGSDLDGEVEHVLRRCGSDRLQSVLKTLTEIVERFGGRTEMSEAREEEMS
jgi:hypothetical protein